MIEPGKPGEGVTVKDVLATHNRGSSQRLVDRRHLDIMIIMFTMTMRMWRKISGMKRTKSMMVMKMTSLTGPAMREVPVSAIAWQPPAQKVVFLKKMIVIIVVVVVEIIINDYDYDGDGDECHNHSAVFLDQ